MRRSMLRRLAVSGALVAGVACGSADAPEPMLSSGLPAGDPTDVGMVDEGLARIRPAMQAYVDDRRVAGVMTMVARQGRVVHWDVGDTTTIIETAIAAAEQVEDAQANVDDRQSLEEPWGCATWPRTTPSSRTTFFVFTR